jgi:hypothetical protein
MAVLCVLVSLWFCLHVGKKREGKGSSSAGFVLFRSLLLVFLGGGGEASNTTQKDLPPWRDIFIKSTPKTTPKILAQSVKLS